MSTKPAGSEGDGVAALARLGIVAGMLEGMGCAGGGCGEDGIRRVVPQEEQDGGCSSLDVIGGRVDQQCRTDFCVPKYAHDSLNLTTSVESGFLVDGSSILYSYWDECTLNTNQLQCRFVIKIQPKILTASHQRTGTVCPPLVAPTLLHIIFPTHACVLTQRHHNPPPTATYSPKGQALLTRCSRRPVDQKSAFHRSG